MTRQLLVAVALVVLWPSTSEASPNKPTAVRAAQTQTKPRDEPQVAAATTRPSAEETAKNAPPTSRPTGDPFRRLRVRIPKNQLGPLRSVRIRDQRERQRGQITVTIRTVPSKAKVSHGGKVLGETPLMLTATHNSTPLDLVIRRKGYMLLRTRIQRRVTRTYSFKLNPAKLR